MTQLKEVHIRRRETKNYMPVPVTANSKRYLSSVYVGQGPLKGIRGKEEKELIAEHLGMDIGENSLPKVMREFWADLRVEIPSDGKTLDITTDDEGKPYNILDYLIYKFAEVHPHVGANKDDMLSDSKKLFYIYDPDEEVKQVNRKVGFKKKAYAELIQIGEDERKLNRLIRLLTDADPEKMNLKQKQNYMDEVIEASPEKFVVVATDKDLELKSLISEMVSENIITKMGNQYWFIDEKIGDDLDDAVRFFKDKKRSSDINRMKAKLQEQTGRIYSESQSKEKSSKTKSKKEDSKEE